MKVFIGLSFLTLAFFCAYQCGYSKGFDRGWDKGFIRGLENPEYTEVTK